MCFLGNLALMLREGQTIDFRLHYENFLIETNRAKLIRKFRVFS